MKKLFLLLATIGVIFTACEGSDDFDKDNDKTNYSSNAFL